MANERNKNVMNLDEAAQFLKMGRPRLIAELEIGRVPAFRDEHGHWRFDRQELTEFMAARQPKPVPGATISLRPKEFMDEDELDGLGNSNS